MPNQGLEGPSEVVAAAKEFAALGILRTNKDLLKANPTTKEAIRDTLRLRRLQREITAKKENPNYAAASTVVTSVAERVEGLYAEAGYSEAGKIADSAINTRLR